MQRHWQFLAVSDERREAAVLRLHAEQLHAARTPVVRHGKDMRVGGRQDIGPADLAPGLGAVGLDRERAIPAFCEVAGDDDVLARAGHQSRGRVVGAPGAPLVVGLPRRGARVVEAHLVVAVDPALGQTADLIVPRWHQLPGFVEPVPHHFHGRRLPLLGHGEIGHAIAAGEIPHAVSLHIVDDHAERGGVCRHLGPHGNRSLRFQRALDVLPRLLEAFRHGGQVAPGVFGRPVELAAGEARLHVVGIPVHREAAAGLVAPEKLHADANGLAGRPAPVLVVDNLPRKLQFVDEALAIGQKRIGRLDAVAERGLTGFVRGTQDRLPAWLLVFLRPRIGMNRRPGALVEAPTGEPAGLLASEHSQLHGICHPAAFGIELRIDGAVERHRVAPDKAEIEVVGVPHRGGLDREAVTHRAIGVAPDLAGEVPLVERAVHLHGSLGRHRRKTLVLGLPPEHVLSVLSGRGGRQDHADQDHADQGHAGRHHAQQHLQESLRHVVFPWCFRCSFVLWRQSSHSPTIFHLPQSLGVSSASLGTSAVIAVALLAQ